MNRFFLTILFFGFIFLYGCYYDKEELLYPLQSSQCDSVQVVWNQQVRDIFAMHCVAACHSTQVKSGTVILDTYQGAKDACLNRNLLCTITWSGGCSPMPKGSSVKIENCKIAKIRRWINQGFPQ